MISSSAETPANTSTSTTEGSGEEDKAYLGSPTVIIAIVGSSVLVSVSLVFCGCCSFYTRWKRKGEEYELGMVLINERSIPIKQNVKQYRSSMSIDYRCSSTHSGFDGGVGGGGGG